jgi:RNA polymerase sigma factor (sigma-70 family)
MKDQITGIGGKDGRFPATSWSLVQGSRAAGPEERRQALERLICQYWKPVYCLIRYSWKKTNEEAKDMTQEFFLSTVLGGGLMEKFAPERGSFRGFLKAAITNFMRDLAKSTGRQKRGGGSRPLSLETSGIALEELLPASETPEPDRLFDESWKRLVFDRALELVEQRLASQGRNITYEIFKRYELQSDLPEMSYKEFGAALGLREDQVKNHLKSARLEFRSAILDVVSDYVGSERDLSLEVKDLFGI